MNGRFFLDTNIFVYSFDLDASAKAKRATNLIESAVTTRKGIVSYQVVQEFFRVALQKFVRPMTTSEAEQYLTTVFRPLWSVHSSPSLFMEAMRIAARYRLAWYDSLIVAAAIESQCVVLYSEDFQHDQRLGNLRISNPFL
jgi:predicted nucleic acid-binding protein